MSVDRDWYLRCYPDVARDVSVDRVPSAQHHYDTFGQFEGRHPVPSKPTFIIHIGPHKTGTTYLQAGLIASRAHLTNNGCEYPAAWIKTGGVSHEDIVPLLEAGDRERARAAFLELAASRATVVISSEDLCFLSIRGIDTLGQALAAYDVRVVFCVRPWPERITSLWKQSLLHSASETFPEFCLRHMADPVSSYAINSTRLLDGWLQVFGETKMILFSYRDVVESGEDLLHYFMSNIVDIPPNPDHVKHAAHVSPDCIGAEIARSLNSISKHCATDCRESLSYLRNSDMYDTSAVRSQMERYVRSASLNSLAPVWDQMEYDFMTRYGHRLIGATRSLRTFRSAMQEYVAPDHMLDPASARALNDLWQDIHARPMMQI